MKINFFIKGEFIKSESCGFDMPLLLRELCDKRRCEIDEHMAKMNLIQYLN